MADYAVMDRYTVTCPQCHGEGCRECRGGEVPVYVLESGQSGIVCSLAGHKKIGQTEHVDRLDRLPRVCWCRRCTWRRVQTDVPEAYDVVA